MIKGEIQPPLFKVENEKIGIRHLYSAALASFWRTKPEYFGYVKDFFGDECPNRGYEEFKAYLEAKPENQVAFYSFVEEILDKHYCPPRPKMQILVALDEIYSNIVKFSGADHVTISMDIIEESFTARVTFVDNGTPFDPLKADDPDITLPVEERDAGGLGVFIVKKTMDGVSYDRKNNCNVFTIEKKLNG